MSMTTALSPEQAAAYRTDGILFPLEALSRDEVRHSAARFTALAAAEGGVLGRETNRKPHLLYPWIADLIRHPSVLDAVEGVIGPDILCWGSTFFHKPAHSPGYISWHQDSTYWGLSGPEVVTAWIALTPSLPISGCMRVVPGSHTSDQVPHHDTFARDNMLSRGQEIAVEVDPATAVDVVLQPGQFSLHHVRIFHGSEPNRAHWPRIGFSVRYIPTCLRQTAGDVRDTASLVRGTDRYGHFEHEPTPASDLHPDAVAYHRGALDRTTRILFAGAAQKR
jgi:hypothetical protein